MIEENIPYALYTASQNIDSSIEMQASVFSLHVKAFARKSIKKSFSSLLRKKNVFMIIMGTYNKQSSNANYDIILE
jgi:CRISPR/Cas system-associated endoribonuclease Cas2